MNHIIEVGTGKLAVKSNEIKLILTKPDFYYRSKQKYIPNRIRLCTDTGKVAMNGPPVIARSQLKESNSAFLLFPKRNNNLEFLFRTQGE